MSLDPVPGCPACDRLGIVCFDCWVPPTPEEEDEQEEASQSLTAWAIEEGYIPDHNHGRTR